MESVTHTKNSWKTTAIILIFLILLLAAAKGIGYLLSKMPSVPNDYTENVQVGGALEEKYLANGTHSTAYMESYAMMSFQKYEIFYPADIQETEGKLPVVIFVNGTGIKGSKYPALQKHMASWGFITIATEEEYAWNGFSAEMSVRFLEKLNSSEQFNEQNNALYRKIDTENIGITGHSQGGYGVVNAVTDQKHAKNYKAAAILSSDAAFNGNDFQWEADAGLIRTPSLIIGSTGAVDSTIASLENLKQLFADIPDSVDKVLARRNDADHGQMLYFADGYVTAWFMYYLQGDAEAGRAFFGDDAELYSNALYQDIQTNVSSTMK